MDEVINILMYEVEKKEYDISISRSDVMRKHKQRVKDDLETAIKILSNEREGDRKHEGKEEYCPMCKEKSQYEKYDKYKICLSCFYARAI